MGENLHIGGNSKMSAEGLGLLIGLLAQWEKTCTYCTGWELWCIGVLKAKAMAALKAVDEPLYWEIKDAGN